MKIYGAYKRNIKKFFQIKIIWKMTELLNILWLISHFCGQKNIVHRVSV